MMHSEKAVETELVKLEVGLFDVEGYLYAYTLGAHRALEWIQTGRRAPSDDISCGVISLLKQ